MHKLLKIKRGSYFKPISLISVVAKHRAIMLGNFNAWPYKLDSYMIL
jgi:hypothetical protein